MDFLDILRDKSFLGREFLTWLWYKSDQSGGGIELPGGKFVEVLFLDRMTLDLADVETPQTVALKGEHSGLREGLAAIREGKKIEEARVSIKSGESDYVTVLKGTWFSYGSFRTPAILPQSELEADEGPEGTFLEKISLIEEGMAAVDALFEYFLKLRISEQWESRELPALRRWVAQESE